MKLIWLFLFCILSGSCFASPANVSVSSQTAGQNAYSAETNPPAPAFAAILLDESFNYQWLDDIQITDTGWVYGYEMDTYFPARINFLENRMEVAPADFYMRGLNDAGEVVGNSGDYDPVIWDNYGVKKVMNFPYEFDFQDRHGTIYGHYSIYIESNIQIEDHNWYFHVTNDYYSESGVWVMKGAISPLYKHSSSGTVSESWTKSPLYQYSQNWTTETSSGDLYEINGINNTGDYYSNAYSSWDSVNVRGLDYAVPFKIESLNDDGFALGNWYDASGDYICVWPVGGEAVFLDDYSDYEAYDICSSATQEYQVVGSHYWKRMKEKDALTGQYTGKLLDEYHRFEWDEVIPPSVRLSEVEAHSISPNGQFILATGTYDNPMTGNPEYRQFVLVEVDLVPDWNRDGAIDDADRGKVTVSTPYRFWINDDDDSGEWDIDDVPQRGNDADAKDLQVDGLRDLVDFFPLYFDLEDFLGSVDDLSIVDLKLSGSSLSFIQYPANFDGIKPSDSWKYLRDLTFARGNLADATSVKVSDNHANPTSLGADFVTLASEGKGVLLLEGVDSSQATAPLVLHAFVNGNEIFTYEFPIELSDVEDMYHHRNLQDKAKNYDSSDEVALIAGESSRSTAPNWPDEQTNGKYFVYLHGFKVDGQRARGEHAECFKRLHQMGSNTRFVGVTWHGAVDPDYHKGVYQALETGEALNGELALNGDITVMAHSLGNVVVSNAIQNGGFLPNRYFMVNAAVAKEAYAFSAIEQDMVEEDWDSIPHRLHAAEWHKVFEGTTDARKNLKWRNYFAGVLQATTVINFHSPGEDVLAYMTGQKTESVYNRIWTWNWNLGRGAWKAQELVKGKNWLDTGGTSWLFERTQSGWRRSQPSSTNWANVTNEEIKTNPVFDRFIENDLTDADSTVAHDKASEKKVEYDLLGRAIPALSYAAARDPIGGEFITDWDMEAKGRAPDLNGEWPVEGHTEDMIRDPGRWLHGDFRANALHFVYPMYEEIIIRGGMKDD